MLGKLQSNIMWDLIPTGASFKNTPIGELYDNIYPIQYSDIQKGYSIANSKLTLREVRNMHVDWSSSTNNLTEIANGVKGQLLYIKSSTNKSIITSDNISVQLGQYNGILLKYNGTKWVPISYNI